MLLSLRQSLGQLVDNKVIHMSYIHVIKKGHNCSFLLEKFLHLQCSDILNLVQRRIRATNAKRLRAFGEFHIQNPTELF